MMLGRTAENAIAAVMEEPPEGPLEPEKLGGYLTRMEPWMEILEPQRVEEWFDKVPGYGSLCGKIDLVSQTTPVVDVRTIKGYKDEPCIIDYKTSNSSAYIKGEREARLSLQPRIYSVVKGIPNVGYIWLLPSGAPIGTFLTLTPEEIEETEILLKETIRIIDWKWDLAWERGQGGAKSVKGYDLSVFQVGPPSAPWINSSHSRHRQLCLGME